MREIKFRAWDSCNEKMIYEFSVNFQNSSLMSIFDLPNDTIDDIDLIQYTGLKDKNGVEIYKSDLLKDDVGRIFKVIEDNRIGSTGYIMECVKNKSEKDHIKIGNIYNFYSWITPFHCLEVIGNIYENPELLN